MWITGVELHNIKSYVQSGTIPFSQGVNTISGPTGAGKSTILEAIGFALFGARMHKQKNFIREGAKKGEITVSLIDSIDEREYQVVRPLGGGDPYVFDPEVKRKLVTGRQDVYDWLKEHMRVSPAADMASLFKDAVGVPQGMLTAPFLEGRTERKRKFDPLLQVDEYERVWSQLLEPINYLKDLQHEQKERIAGLHGELKRLPQLEKETGGLEEEISKGEQELVSVRVQFGELNGQKKNLDELEKLISDLVSNHEALEGQLTGLKKQITDAKMALEEAREAQKVLAESEANYQSYEEAQAKLSELEKKRGERDDLKARLADVGREEALAQQRIERLEKELDAIAQAEAQMIALEPQVAEQNRLTESLKGAETNFIEWEAASERVSEEVQDLQRCIAALEQVCAGLERLKALKNKTTKLNASRQALEAEAANINASQKQIRAQRDRINERIDLLQQTEEAECPLCRKPLRDHEVETLKEHFNTELADLAVKEGAKKERLTKIEKELWLVNLQLDELAQQIAALPHPGRETELKHEVEEQRQNLEKWKQKTNALAGASDRVAWFKEQLAKLGDPQSKHETLKARKVACAKVERELTVSREEHGKYEKERLRVSKTLEGFDTLDRDIQTQKEETGIHRSGHDRYIEYIKTARDLPKREARVEELAAYETKAKGEKAQVEEKVKSVRGNYDKKMHQEINEQFQELGQKRAALEERIVIQKGRKNTVDSEIELLVPLQGELETLAKESEFTQSLSEALEFLRKTIREAGPYITRKLVQTISAEADRIFGEIMNDYTARLNWSEDYEITIEQLGNRREFSQLSGGEKMAAALAVRLALLREMSAIRIAFFDEPTAHLDEERRSNLASQITQIKGFSQLFVISHDDTFERDTHHVLHVSKENGVSRVEVG